MLPAQVQRCRKLWGHLRLPPSQTQRCRSLWGHLRLVTPVPVGHKHGSGELGRLQTTAWRDLRPRHTAALARYKRMRGDLRRPEDKSGGRKTKACDARTPGVFSQRRRQLRPERGLTRRHCPRTASEITDKRTWGDLCLGFSVGSGCACSRGPPGPRLPTTAGTLESGGSRRWENF